MGKSQETWNKKEKEKKRLLKRKEKAAKKEDRKSNSGSGNWEDMIAYVDENGQITNEAPDPTVKKRKINAEEIELGIPKKEDVEDVPLEGVIAFFNHEKGYGFINQIGSGEKFFVHVNGLLEEVSEGNKVSFETDMGPKGIMAVKVKKIK